MSIKILGINEEMAENERMWREENDAPVKPNPTSATELRSAGVSTAGIQADLDAAEPSDSSNCPRRR